MTFIKNELVGYLRAAARMTYMASQGLEEYQSDVTNHLSPTDVVEVKNLIKSIKESLKDTVESISVFERELETRKVSV